MTTLNTIIEIDATITRFVETQRVKALLTTAMQRAYEAGREERDTYWKEKCYCKDKGVIELIEEAVKEEREKIRKDVTELQNDMKEAELCYDKDVDITEIPPALNAEVLGIKKGMESAFNQVLEKIGPPLTPTPITNEDNLK